MPTRDNGGKVIMAKGKWRLSCFGGETGSSSDATTIVLQQSTEKVIIESDSQVVTKSINRRTNVPKDIIDLVT